MSTIYLTFPDIATAKTAMSGFFDAVKGWNTASLVHALDPVGILYNNDATFDASGNVLTNATPKSGWHMNFVGALPSTAQAYIVSVLTPDRIFSV